MKLNCFKPLLLSISITVLVACGGGGGSSDQRQQNTPVQDQQQESITSIQDTGNTQDISNMTDVMSGWTESTLPPSNMLDDDIGVMENCSQNELLKNDFCTSKEQEVATNTLIKHMIVNNKYDLFRRPDQGTASAIDTLTPSICKANNNVVEAVAVGQCILSFNTQSTQRTLRTQATQITLPVYTARNVPASDVSNCQAGTLAQSHKDTALKTLNEIRALHGLSPVSYDSSFDDEMMQAALINAANQTLSHKPSSTSKCYSDVGYNGTNTSNIELNYYDKLTELNGVDPIRNALTEQYSTNLGHRRWLLSPFLKRISFGAIADISNHWSHQYIVGYSTKVIFPEDSFKPTQHKKGVIAYPYQNYPVKYFVRGVPLSLSILEDQSNSGSNVSVRFNNATVTVTERASGVVQKITNVSFDNLGMGLPNSLQFNFNDLIYGKTYDVQISNVRFNGEVKNYKYWFKIVE